MSEKYNIEELIIRFLQQDINEEELRYLESWLEEDAEHKSYFFGLKSISDSSRRSFFTKEEVNEASWQRMYARLDKGNEEISSYNKSRTHNLWLSFIKYAAIVIIAVGLGWGISEFQENGYLSNTKEKEIVYNEIHIQKGGRANTLILSDGTKVILNAATTFKYPTSFNEKNRKVYLDGEAYFEVAKDAKKPFVVKLKKQDITVLGTTFNVQAYENESYSIVTLLSGRVMLDAFNEFGESTSRMFLKPNQRALSDNNSGSVSLCEVNASFSNAWINGEYKFKDEPLLSICKRLENYYNVQIHLNDSCLEQIRYTGTFSLDQDIMDVFRIIDYEKQFTFKRAKRDIFITNK
ncbi:FecR family protein [Parabacteroides sp. ASD2025]|uniref:FecR family protein n=1 Tax=Parabacteroides sp. ASD2025 TaxID=3415987 RepID=UPI003CFAF3A0